MQRRCTCGGGRGGDRRASSSLALAGAARRRARPAGGRRGPQVLRPAPRDDRPAGDAAARRRAACGTTRSPTRCRSGSADCPSSSPTSGSPRSPARSSAASPASPSSPSWRSPCSIDGENLLGRFRRLLHPSRRAQADEVGGVMYRTLGRYFGGSITVAVLMGLCVLALGLVLGIPLDPAGRAVGDAHGPHPPGRRLPRGLVPRRCWRHAGRHDGA